LAPAAENGFEKQSKPAGLKTIKINQVTPFSDGGKPGLSAEGRT
jgi:hypothetical protein